MCEKKVHRPEQAIRRRGLITVAVFLLLTGLMTVGMLQLFQQRNEEIFNDLVEETLTSTHQGQVREIQGVLQETVGMLETVASIYSDSASAPDLAGISTYLTTLHQVNNLYDVRFYPAEVLRTAANIPEGNVLDKGISIRLLAGETVISDVVNSQRLGGLSVFSVSVPLRQDGEVVGALRCLLKADLLLHTGEKLEYDRSRSLLVLRDGAVILNGEEYLDGRENLLAGLAVRGVQEGEIQAVAEALQAQQNPLVTINGYNKDRAFIMLSSLGYNDWMLLSLSRSNEIGTYSDSIMHNTTTLIFSLLLFLLLLMCGSWLAYQQQRQRLAHSQARYDLLARFSDTMLFEYDCEKKTLVFTPNIANEFDVSGTAAIRPFDHAFAFQVVHPEDAGAMQTFLRHAETMVGERMESLTIRMRNRLGEYRWMSFQGQLLRNEDGRPLVLAGKISDVHEQRSKEQRLIRKSSIDAMTGALNRETTESVIAQRLQSAGDGFLFMLDVDDFKSVNDTLGHSVGDQILTRFVETIRSTFRQEDVVGRIGGDEFVIFIDKATSRSIAIQRAEELLEKLAQWESPRLSTSIGIAAFPTDGVTYADLYEAADAAMYEAKRRGKNGYYFTEENRTSQR